MLLYKLRLFIEILTTEKNSISTCVKIRFFYVCLISPITCSMFQCWIDVTRCFNAECPLWCWISQNLSIFSRNIFGSSSAIFVNFRKSSENVRKHSYDLRTTFWKSSEIFRKINGRNLRKIFKNLVISRFIK